MSSVSCSETGKTLYIKLRVYRCGGVDPLNNLGICWFDSGKRFETTLSNEGLEFFRDNVLKFYKKYILDRNQGS
jgi:hypothetical protein